MSKRYLQKDIIYGANASSDLCQVTWKYTGIPICSVATFAAFQEGYFIRTERE